MQRQRELETAEMTGTQKHAAFLSELKVLDGILAGDTVSAHLDHWNIRHARQISGANAGWERAEERSSVQLERCIDMRQDTRRNILLMERMMWTGTHFH